MNNVLAHNQNQSTPDTIASEDRINLGDYVTVVLRYRKIVFWCCAAAMAVTATVNLLLPKVYMAAATLLPPIEVLQKESKLAGGLGAGQGSAIADLMGVTSVSDIYVAILKSQVVEDAVIDALDLMKVYEVNKRVLARQELRRNASIEAGRDGTVTVSVRDKNPQRAAAIVNAFVEELDRQNKRLYVGQATSKRIFLENRLKEIEDKLSKIDNILSREAKIQEMLFELLTREYEIAKIEEAKTMPTIQILDRAEPPELCVPRRTLTRTAVAGVVSFMCLVAGVLAFDHFARTGAGVSDSRRRQSRALRACASFEERSYNGQSGATAEYAHAGSCERSP